MSLWGCSIQIIAPDIHIYHTFKNFILDEGPREMGNLPPNKEVILITLTVITARNSILLWIQNLFTHNCDPLTIPRSAKSGRHRMRIP